MDVDKARYLLDGCVRLMSSGSLNEAIFTRHPVDAKRAAEMTQMGVRENLGKAVASLADLEVVCRPGLPEGFVVFEARVRVIPDRVYQEIMEALKP